MEQLPRSLAADNLKKAIAYNATSVKTVTLAENLIIGLLAQCGTTGKAGCFQLLNQLNKIRGGFILAPSSINPKIIQFHNNYNNIINEHTLRRHFNGCALQKHVKQYYAIKLINPPIPLNIPVIFGWTIFGLTVTGVSLLVSLYLFNRSLKKRYRNNQVIIDVVAIEDED